MIGKLLGAATIGSTLASVGLLNRFLSGLANIVMLAIVSAFMLCVLLAGGFYLAYSGLVYYGLDPIAAVITLAVIALFMTGALVALTIDQIRQLRDLPNRAHRSSSGIPDIAGLAEAFIQGFLGPRL